MRLVITSRPILAQQDSIRVILVIGQYNRSVKGIVNTSCLYEGTERVMRALLSRISPSKLLFSVFLKTYNQCLVFFPKFVIVLIN